MDADMMLLKTALNFCKEADKTFEIIFPSSMVKNITNYNQKDHVNTENNSGLSALLMLLYIGFSVTTSANVEDKKRLKFVNTISKFASSEVLLVGLRGLGLSLFSASEHPVRFFYIFVLYSLS